MELAGELILNIYQVYLPPEAASCLRGFLAITEGFKNPRLKKSIKKKIQKL